MRSSLAISVVLYAANDAQTQAWLELTAIFGVFAGIPLWVDGARIRSVVARLDLDELRAHRKRAAERVKSSG